ncbi:MAG: hypothetical protein Q8N51_11425, partial [Gammaproteobacteria bacterium]|nr:hypothetical protein [Gammaproteobacteria bacterium]
RHEAGKDRMLEFLMFMSDDDNDRPLIRNEDTLRRRAWIDRALAGVRDRLKPDEMGEMPVSGQPAVPVVPVVAANPANELASDLASSRPRLYVIRNRTSG